MDILLRTVIMRDAKVKTAIQQALPHSIEIPASRGGENSFQHMRRWLEQQYGSELYGEQTRDSGPAITNPNGVWSGVGSHIYFLNANDAFAFKMRWA